MAGRGRRFAAGLAAAALAGGVSIVVSVTPAYAAACSTTASGVTVVVDFAGLGGGVHVACAAGDPASGYAALHSAGFSTAGTVHDGPAFVCRIDDEPPPSSEPCTATPPTTRYWSYWHAQPGGRWTYSQLGSMGYNPAPGSVEGWAFGAGAAPDIRPPALVAPPPPPPPAPTTKRTTGHGSTPVVTQPGGATATATDPAPPLSSGPAVDPTDQSPTPSGAALDQVAAPASGPGRPTGTIIGLAVIVLIGAAGGAAVLRRRRRPGSTPSPTDVDDG
jgi:hypothetical protein